MGGADAVESPGAQSARVQEGTLLFTPSRQRVERAQITAYLAWLAGSRSLRFGTYDELWAWSVADLDGFWSSIWQWSGLSASRPAVATCERGAGAEGGRFLVGAELNYVDQALRWPDGEIAVIAVDESGTRSETTYGELRAVVGAAAAGLRRLGVGRGDRVAAVLPNGLPAVAAFLATASIGAVWSSCAPEFGVASLVDRFSQIAPSVLLVAERYRYGGRVFELADKASALTEALGDQLVTVVVPEAGARPDTSPAGDRGTGRRTWAELCAEPAVLEPIQVPADHPIWVLYSSGTTGLPKPIAHSHGGILLEHVKVLSLHQDLRPGDRFFWFTTTGWMMWNYLVGGLLVGATIVCYDGNPLHPDASPLWRMASEVGVTCFGVSAPYLEACRRAGYSPRAALDLGSVRTVGSTGAPLSPEGFAWASSEVGDDVAVGSISGGTDVCTSFLAACPILPVHAGELQCRALGAAVAAFDPAGHGLVGEVGELVVTEPMPSMPLGLWGDADGSRLHASYFSTFPGVWRHGDWIKLTERNSAIIYGRSDATLNRGGIRMGTAELYRVVDTIDAVADSLAVDTSELGRDGELILFVVRSDTDADADAAGAHTGAQTGARPDEPPEALADRLRAAIRADLSPRHVPDRIVEVPAIPRTLNGKKVEVPIRRILLGAAPGDVVSPDALAEPAALDQLVAVMHEVGLI